VALGIAGPALVGECVDRQARAYLWQHRDVLSAAVSGRHPPTIVTLVTSDQPISRWAHDSQLVHCGMAWLPPAVLQDHANAWTPVPALQPNKASPAIFAAHCIQSETHRVAFRFSSVAILAGFKMDPLGRHFNSYTGFWVAPQSRCPLTRAEVPSRGSQPIATCSVRTMLSVSFHRFGCFFPRNLHHRSNVSSDPVS